MKFETSVGALLPALAAAGAACDSGKAMPILSHVLLSVAGAGAECVGSDLQMEIRATAELGEPASLEGAICVPGRKIIDVLKTFGPDDRLRAHLDEEKLRLHIAGSRFSLATRPATDFPAFDRNRSLIGTVTVRGVDLARPIEKVRYCMATPKDVRYYLVGLLLEVAGGKLRAVASDGARLARCEMSVAADFERQSIVHRDSVPELLRAAQSAGDAEITLAIHEGMIVADHGGRSLAIKLVEGRYPPVNRIIPREFVREITAAPSGILAALDRGALANPDRVVMAAEGAAVEFRGSNEAGEESTGTAEITLKGEPWESGWNPRYLEETLGRIDGGAVSLEFSENGYCVATDPADGSHLHVVCPFRL